MTPQQSTKLPKHYASKFQAYRNIVQIIPSPLPTTIQIDTIAYDILNEVSLVTYRFTPIETGYYYLHGYATFAPAVPVNTVCEILFWRVAGAFPSNSKIADGANPTYMHVSYVFHLLVGEWVELQVAQNSGANQNLLGGLLNQVFEGFRVG